jgi:lysophospholipase L1-like esterase
LYGDSTTKHNTYAELNGLGIVVINKGIGSSKASDILKGSNAYYQRAWVEEVSNSCDIVVINFGLNDAYYDKFEPVVFAKQLSDMRTIAEARGKTVILETPNPMSGPGGGLVAEYAKAVRNLGGLIVDNHALFGDVYKAEWMVDNAHPTTYGYTQKTLNLKKALLSL